MHFGGREFGLRRLDGAGRHHFVGAVDATGLEEIDHRATVLGLDLRHFGTGNAQRARLLRKRRPLVVNLVARYWVGLRGFTLRWAHHVAAYHLHHFAALLFGAQLGTVLEGERLAVVAQDVAVLRLGGCCDW